MALAQKALGAWILAKFIQKHRRPRYRRNTFTRRPTARLLPSLTPLGRLSLGGLAILAARRLMGRRQSPA